MKKNTALTALSLLVVIFAFSVMNVRAFTSTGFAPVTDSPVLMYEKAILGPDPTNAAYAAWASNVVASIYNTGQVPGETNGSALGYRLDPSYIAQNTSNYTNSMLWFVIHVKAIDSSFRFSPSNLVFVGRSSDGNSLGKVNYFTNATYIYSPWALGINWGPSGPRLSDTIMNSASAGPWGSVPVNEFIFIGAMSTYYTYTSPAGLDGINAYVTNFTTGIGFSVTGQWMLTTNNTVSGSIALSQVTLQTKGAPLTPVQTIKEIPFGSKHVSLGVNMETNRTIVVQFRETLNHGGWKDICTMNSSELIDWNTLVPNSNDPTGFFRFGLQE